MKELGKLGSALEAHQPASLGDTLSMKSELKAKFLQHLASKKKDQGFTLIELLVVIIIIGILSAIALPSFLNQANKAKQSEAKQYVGTLNRVQQAYYLEKSKFAPELLDLANPVPSETDNYLYEFKTSTSNVANYGLSNKDALKSYSGMVAISVVTDSSDATTTAILCEAKAPGKLAKGDVSLAPSPPEAGSPDRPACVKATTTEVGSSK